MQKTKEYLLILMGTLLYVIGINYFIVTANIFSAGIMGLAQEIAQSINFIFDLNLATIDKQYLYIQTIAYWCLNLPAIILGYIKVGKNFTTKTLLCSFIIIPLFMNLLIPTTSLLLDTNGELTLASQILSAVFGGALTGAGMGIIFKYGASSGGTDIIATYFAIFKGKSFGIYNLMINVIVMAWSILLYHSIQVAVLLLILIYVQSKTVDYIYNFHDKVTLLVITKKEKEIHDYVVKKFDRTYTTLHATSGYSQEATNVLLFVINKEELNKVSIHLKMIDDECFIDVIQTQSIKGNFHNRFQEKL